MITEELLERGLHAAGDRYDVPPGAVDRIHDRLTQPAAAHQPRVGLAWRPRTGMAWAAAALVVVAVAIGVPFALGGAPQRGLTAANLPSRSQTSAGTTLAQQARPHRAEGAVNGSAAGAAGGAGGPAGVPEPAATPTAAASPPSGQPGSTFGKAASADQTQPDRVVKTGTVALQVPAGQVAPTLQQVGNLATGVGGFVESSNSQTAGTAPSGEVTLRVPVASFERVQSEVTRLSGVKVLSEQSAGQDVTGRYVDLRARIHALSATRSTYLTILGRATTIGQTLVIQQHITGVQSQIEQLQGQLKLLANHAAMSTLTVEVDQPARPVSVAHHAAPPNGFGHAVSVSVDRFVRGVDVIVGLLGPLLLALILVALAWLIGRIAIRRLRRDLV